MFIASELRCSPIWAQRETCLTVLPRTLKISTRPSKELKKAPQRGDLAIYFRVARSRNSIPKAGGCCDACPSWQCAQQVTGESAAIGCMAGSQSGDCLQSISTSSTWCSLRRPFPFYPIIRASWQKSMGNQGCTTALTHHFPHWVDSPARVPNMKSSK